MSYPLLIAAVLLIATATVHTVLGERYVISRLLRRTEIPHLFGSDWFTRRTIRFAWHLTTVVWLGLAAVLVLLGRETGLTGSADGVAREVGVVVAITLAVHAVIAAGASRFRHPAWVTFGAAAVLTWIGVG